METRRSKRVGLFLTVFALVGLVTHIGVGVSGFGANPRQLRFAVLWVSPLGLALMLMCLDLLMANERMRRRESPGGAVFRSLGRFQIHWGTNYLSAQLSNSFGVVLGAGVFFLGWIGFLS